MDVVTFSEFAEAYSLGKDLSKGSITFARARKGERGVAVPIIFSDDDVEAMLKSAAEAGLMVETDNGSYTLVFRGSGERFTDSQGITQIRRNSQAALVKGATYGSLEAALGE